MGGRDGEGLEKLVRVFCAVELPREVRARVARYAAELRAGFEGVRAGWEREEKLHLTLKFVGEVEPRRVEALERAASRAAAGVQPFAISIGGTGAFPPKGPPRVLWLGVGDGTGGLRSLQSRLEDECHAEGFARERKGFSPHLTLARLRDPAGARRLAEEHRRARFGPLSLNVSELLVVRSDLGPTGSRYTTLSRHALPAG